MKKRTSIILTISALVFGIGVAYSMGINPRNPVVYFKGHSHPVDGLTVGAPEHSGGTDKYGCHNASVPYHCH
jgi:hypothetical protein